MPNSFIVISDICNMLLNKYTATKKPTNVVLNKNACNLLNGIHTSKTARILTNPISKYIIVTSGPSAIPSTGPIYVKNMMLSNITIANGAAFRRTVCKNMPLTGLLFGSNDIKNDVYASITKSISVICIGINGNAVFVTMQNSDNNTEYMVFIKKILATLVRLFTTLLPSISTSFNTLKS